MGEAIRWWLALEVLGLVSLPLCGLVFRALPDRGYALSKVFGWVLVGWLAWLSASIGITVWGQPAARFFTTLVLVGSTVALFRHRGAYARAWRVYLGERRGYILAVELLFALAFAALALLRAYVPDAAYTEKPMEYMYLQGLYTATSMPPADLWLSGERVNYYYFGYALNAFVGLWSGVGPREGFNLALAGTWATAVVTMAGVGYNAAASFGAARPARLLGAALPVLLVFLLASPAGVAAALGPKQPGDDWNWWFGRATRVIYDVFPGGADPGETINEFPAFSFLLGDLHPHVLAMPLFALGLGCSLALLLSVGRPLGQLRLLAQYTGLVVGWLYMTNSWDVPVILALAVLAPIAAAVGRRWPVRLLLAAVVLAFCLVGAVAAAAPFLLSYDAPVSATAEVPAPVARIPVVGSLAKAVGVVTWDRSELGEFLRVWGSQLAVVLAVLAAYRSRIARAAWIGAGALLLLALAAALALAAPVLLLAPAALLCLALALGMEERSEEPRQGAEVLRAEPSRRGGEQTRNPVVTPGAAPASTAATLPNQAAVAPAESSPTSAASITSASHRWGFLLCSAALALIVAPEVVYLRDVFESRMNTVFKLYFQAWQLLGLACTLLLLALADRLGRLLGSRAHTAVALAILVAILAAALVYPMQGVRARASGDRRGLDATAFLAREDPGAHAAVQWLVANSPPDTVVLEATGLPYTFFGRVATYSGRPTVLGWHGHEVQWRAGQPELLAEAARRATDLRTLYDIRTGAPGRSLLARYGVRYAVYGKMERQMQTEIEAPVEDPFRDELTPVLTEGDTVLYAVR